MLRNAYLRVADQFPVRKSLARMKIDTISSRRCTSFFVLFSFALDILFLRFFPFPDLFLLDGLILLTMNFGDKSARIFTNTIDHVKVGGPGGKPSGSARPCMVQIALKSHLFRHEIPLCLGRPSESNGVPVSIIDLR